MDIINKSITRSIFRSQLKTAVVTPVLKKPDLDENEPSNYRPVSNLPYLGKVTEKIVVTASKSHQQA